MRRIAPYLVLLLCLVLVGVPVTAHSGRMVASDQDFGIRTDQVSVSVDHDGLLPDEPGETGIGGDRTVGDDDAPGETVNGGKCQFGPPSEGLKFWLTLQACGFWIVVL